MELGICLAVSTINTTTMVVGLKLLKANIYFKFKFAVSQKFRMPVAVFTCIVGNRFVVTSTECIPLPTPDVNAATFIAHWVFSPGRLLSPAGVDSVETIFS